MKAWLAQHARTFASAVGKLVRNPLASALNIGVIGVALALPAGLYVALATLQGLAGQLAVEPQLSLFLKRDAGRSDVADIERRLKSHPGVRRASFVSREKALRDIKARTGLADVIDALDHNPLPDAFIVEAADASSQALEALREEFRGWPKVEHVQLDSAWARRLEALVGLGRLAVFALGTLFAFALVAITFNTIRLQIMTQRDEIEVVKLIGATESFIRRPFLYFGTLLGLGGGAAAWMIVELGIRVFNNGLESLAQLYGIALQIQPLGLANGLSLLAFAAGLGWLGAWLSVSLQSAKLRPR